MDEQYKPYDPHEIEPIPEGEEEAPPFVKTMAVIRWIILGGMTIFALIMILNYFGATPWANASDESLQYHCPMHPTYISSQPGECPICGMTLVAINKEGKEIQEKGTAGTTEPQQILGEHTMAASERYICPMHPEVISDKPGKCPKCGMNLIKVEATDTTKTTQRQEPATRQKLPKADRYTCPMHPEVISDKPGKCPECGMNLEKAPVSALPQSENDMQGMEGMSESSPSLQYDQTDLGNSPVPGLVPVTIEPQRLQLIGVRTGTVERRSLGGSIQVVGFITPDETRLFNLHVRFSGWVKKLNADQTGQFVEAGEKLLSVYSQELYQAEQDYIVARQSASRADNDNELTEIRNQLFEVARQRLELLEIPSDEIARLDSGGAPGSELWIRSPFSGYVIEKNVFDGQFIGPDQNLFTIADLNKVWVLADIYEKDLTNIKLRQKALMTATAYPGESFTGTVAFIYPTLSEQTRTLKTRIEFANPAMLLRPGMYVDVELYTEGASKLTVPADAVMDDGDKQYAFVVHDDKHFEPRLLKIGRRSNDYIEILAGLSKGEIVVTSANFLIDSESRLKAALAGMGSTEPDAHAGHAR